MKSSPLVPGFIVGAILGLILWLGSGILAVLGQHNHRLC